MASTPVGNPRGDARSIRGQKLLTRSVEKRCLAVLAIVDHEAEI